MRKILYIIFFLVFISSAYGATIYKWVDKEGVVNFTDDLSKVPFSYRNRVEVEERKDVKEKVTPPPPRQQLLGTNRTRSRRTFTAEMSPGGVKRCVHGRKN